ncbi:hypothetical protein [Campylobacter sputorum]|uniref:hypothetical protein n=1 Tax=Campylobacter sputorum TaxID=206 RepID=UPI00053BEC32|nr:hypothetical protein [Campylobacter sputorum]
MLNKISNKLDIYILVLLVVAFAMELFVSQYFISKIQAIENLSAHFQRNPDLIQHQEDMKHALVDAIISSGLNEIAFVYANEDTAFI